MIPFIILSQPRSGTQLLSNLLNQHPHIGAAGEILNTDRELADHDLIFQAWRRTDHYTRRAAGITVMAEQLAARPFTLPTLLQLPNMHIIVLERANQLERLRSVAQAGTVWNWNVDQPAEHLPAVELHPGETLRALQAATMWHTQLATIPNWLTWIYYEDLITDHRPIMNALWAFLEVDNPGPVKPSTFRQETRPLSDTVTNYDALADVLAGTRYEHQLKQP